MNKIINLEVNERSIKKISVVCPYYNEEIIIGEAVSKMITVLKTIDFEWELILVNDGSKDDSLNIVREETKDCDRAILVTYSVNQGRGYALRMGIEHASGDLIITTESDLSWGEDIVHKIIDKFLGNEKIDCVVASPNIEGGGYINVPFYRVFISKIGNILIKNFFDPNISMNTGMTRGYRKEVIKSIKTEEKGKEFHLEVLLKLDLLNFCITEVPATLEWKKINGAKDKKEKKRVSKTKIPRLIKTHLFFVFFARPIKYFWIISMIIFFISMIFLVYGVYLFINDEISIYMGLMSLLMAIFSLLFFGFGIITDQNISIMKELWKKNK